MKPFVNLALAVFVCYCAFGCDGDASPTLSERASGSVAFLLLTGINAKDLDSAHKLPKFNLSGVLPVSSFVVELEGESLCERGLYPGDLLIADLDAHACPGDVVVEVGAEGCRVWEVPAMRLRAVCDRQERLPEGVVRYLLRRV